jgi:hypothetical protein
MLVDGYLSTVLSAPLLAALIPIALMVSTAKSKRIIVTDTPCVTTGWPFYYSALQVVSAIKQALHLNGNITATPVSSHVSPRDFVSGSFAIKCPDSMSFPELRLFGQAKDQVQIRFAMNGRRNLPYEKMHELPLPPTLEDHTPAVDGALTRGTPTDGAQLMVLCYS